MSLNPFHVIIILVLGVLFFGRNLPGVARQIGTALIEFRKGLDDWKEVRQRSSGRSGSSSNKTTVMQDEPEERFESLGTKFEPPSDNT